MFVLFLNIVFENMDRKRIGRSYGFARAPSKKALKPLFVDDQTPDSYQANVKTQQEES